MVEPQIPDLEIWYGLAIVPGKTLLPPILGMEDTPCRLIEAGELGMVGCPVSWSAYNQQAMHMHMEELAWVEAHARRHEQVIQTIMDSIPAIPLPFATVFINEDRVREELTAKDGTLHQELERLGRSRELTVKLWANRDVLAVKLKDSLPFEGGQGGSDYFRKRRWEKTFDERVESLCNEYGETLFQSLKELAQEVQLRETAGIEPRPGLSPVFIATFMIKTEGYPAWQAKVAAFDQTADPWGFVLDISGPWPPYHFTGPVGGESDIGGNRGREAGKIAGSTGEAAG